MEGQLQEAPEEMQKREVLSQWLGKVIQKA